MHACEWIGPATVMFLAEALLERHDLLSAMDVYLLPVVNVDGYRLTWEGDRFLRNSPSGVNPNLNFPPAFGRFGPLVKLLYRPERPGSALYHGPEPLSEPCCREVANALRGVQDLKLFIDFHSYGQKWGVPYVYTRRRAPDYQRLKAGADLAAASARQVHGTEYEVMQLAELETGGGCVMDWVYEELRVPYSYTVELRPDLPQGLPFLWGVLSKGLKGLYREGFALPEEEIAEVGEEMLAGVTTLMAHVLEATDAGA